MAEYLIQGETLDDIADAINAKTGGSSAMTPAEMVTAIEGIETGGGEKTLTKLVEYVVTTPLARIDITITDEMRSCEILYLNLVGLTLSADDWMYPTLNGISIVSGGMGYTNKASSLTGVLACLPIKNAFNMTRRLFIGALMSAIRNVVITTPSTLNLRLYTSGVQFTSGTIEIWGYV